jgi:hypothetical protein
MGYYLQAFICTKPDSKLLTERYDNAIAVDLRQGLSLIPMTAELFDQISNFSSSPSVGKFEFMTEIIERNVLAAIGDNKFAYVEAEYFGGEGGQIAVIWDSNRRRKLLSFGQGKINEVLNDFGIVASHEKDEFLAVGLGLHRDTSDWLEDRN